MAAEFDLRTSVVVMSTLLLAVNAVLVGISFQRTCDLISGSSAFISTV